MRSVARTHDVTLATVQWWLRRAGDRSLDHVDWSDQPPIPRRSRRTQGAVEDLVLVLRRELKETSDLGEYGARAIYREFAARGLGVVPSVRTIGRVLERRGALDAGRRVRRPPPPAGWYLPEVGAGRAELDSFDTVEGLTFEGGLRIEVLNVVSLHGGLPGSWPQPLVTAKTAVEALVEHWREFGLPGYAQFDNDTVFQGSHHGQDSLGRVVRTCLRLGSFRSSRLPKRVASKRPSKTSTAAGKPKSGLASTTRRSPPSTSVPGAISAPTASAPPPVSRRLPSGGRSRPPGGRTCRLIRSEWSSSSAAVPRRVRSACWAVPSRYMPSGRIGSFAAT